MFLKDCKGFAYIDFIIGVVIMGIAVVPVIIIILSLRIDNNQVLLQSRAVTYANSIMHHIRAHRFDEAFDSPWTIPASLGSESGDSDDVDDYKNANWPGIISGFPDFSVSTNIYYVDAASDWLIKAQWAGVDSITNYKKIDIIISHPNLSTPVSLSSLVTPLGFFP